ncbi:MAG: putative tRNA threonylcarbamoyladenosine biosynthesis protein Gcp [Candidatus Nomurabacteria bacterium GW2011_GWA2_40_9]|uniref:tRNA N6-adenosine threonylcarbamoyltransferase n=1 Tax=Candidatus Nomurabacteria bacterium GW2011_GWA2_40_9 TaxID=1618734 RepID=A0A0G0WWJ4_9BACT|nr:MAG: putative tRNA threonylcarbamoyladenosine biosynthesis protein Gcp [Candidatus Nomurabacteria bacterium GW2011_GWA2_40_9]
MIILSIETSCDETGLTIFKAKGNQNKASFEILATTLSSQVKIHAQYGGVFPMMAKREHQKNLPILFKKTLKKAFPSSPAKGRTEEGSEDIEQKNPGIDLIVVTSGPGLEPALWTGIVFAKELALKYKIPLIPVNHMEGHILSVFAKNKGTFTIPLRRQGSGGQAKINFPILSLLVSGGHTELVLMRDWLKYEVIGQTLDDAAGEAFDKVARMMELPYPGGPEISRLAEEFRKNISSSPAKGRIEEGSDPLAFQALPLSRGRKIRILLPRPMMYSKNFDFSFSGLKTAVLYLIRDLKKENVNILKDEKIKAQIACEFENAVVETLVYKTKKAIEKYEAKTLIVAGGVSANKHLKKEMQKMLKDTNSKTKLLFPDKKLTGDNSVMIGVAGYLKYIKNKMKNIKLDSIKAEGNLKL